MRALTCHGKHDVRVDTVPDPKIVNPRDAIIKITSTAICGSDLYLYDHTIPTMKAGDVLGHTSLDMEMVLEETPNSRRRVLKRHPGEWSSAGTDLDALAAERWTTAG
jgi:hypothetical protein